MINGGGGLQIRNEDGAFLNFWYLNFMLGLFCLKANLPPDLGSGRLEIPAFSMALIILFPCWINQHQKLNSEKWSGPSLNVTGKEFFIVRPVSYYLLHTLAHSSGACADHTLYGELRVATLMK